MAFENRSCWGGECYYWQSAQVLAGGGPLPFGNKIGSLSLEQARCFPYDALPCLSTASAVSSPGESSASPHETEGEEEDDYIAGLAERIAHSMLDDDDACDEKFEITNRSWAFEKDMWTSDVRKACAVISPPPATVPGRGSLLTSSWSSNSSSKISSPASTPLGSQQDAWDLLYAAAGEVLRLKMSEESKASGACLPWQGGAHRITTAAASMPGQIQQQPRRRSHTQLAHPMLLYSGQAAELPAGNHSSVGSAHGFCKDRNAASAHCHQRSLSSKSREEDRKLSGCHARPPNPDPMHGSAASSWGRNSRSILQQQQQSSGGHRCGKKGGYGQLPSWASDALSSQRSQLQLAGGSGMRAAFLGSGVGRESCGTGVFLPRRHGSAMDTNKKPACSTVLLPARIAQALNMNAEGVCSSPLRQNASMLLATTRREFTSLPSSPSSAPTCPSKTSPKVGREAWIDPDRKLMCTQPCSLQREMSLPTEWSY